MVRPSSTIFKGLLLKNRLDYQSQISYRASLGRGNKSLFTGSGSLDQNGRHMWKKQTNKNGKKSDSKGIFLNWQQMGKVIRNFCWHQSFVPKRLSVPVLGLYTCIKSFKMCLKSYFKETVLKLATNGQSDKGFLLTSTLVPKALSAPALGLNTRLKALKYIPGPGVGWVFTGPLVLWFDFLMLLWFPQGIALMLHFGFLPFGCAKALLSSI